MKELLQHRLKYLRETISLTQKQLADAVNTTRASIASYESGNNTPPAEVLISLATFFNVSTDYLLGLTSTSMPYKNAVPISLVSEEKALLETYRLLSEQAKGKLQERAKMLLEDELLQQKTVKKGTA